MDNELGNVISTEVTRAESDLDNFRSRGLGILGVSGGLVTLTTGFITVASGAAHKEVLAADQRWVLGVGFAAYVLAAVFALFTNVPQKVKLADAENLENFVQNDWDDEGWDKQEALLGARYLKSLRKVTRRNARLLLAAIIFEIVGIGFTAAIAFVVLEHFRVLANL
jgi:hypothetical protein